MEKRLGCLSIKEDEPDFEAASSPAEPGPPPPRRYLRCVRRPGCGRVSRDLTPPQSCVVPCVVPCYIPTFRPPSDRQRQRLCFNFDDAHQTFISGISTYIATMRLSKRAGPPAMSPAPTRRARLVVRSVASSNRPRTVGSRNKAAVLQRERLPSGSHDERRRLGLDDDDDMQAFGGTSVTLIPDVALDAIGAWWSTIPARSKLVAALSSAFCLSNMDKVNMTVAGEWAAVE